MREIKEVNHCRRVEISVDSGAEPTGWLSDLCQDLAPHTAPIRKTLIAVEDVDNQSHDVIFPNDGQAVALPQASGEMTRVHHTGGWCELDAEELSSAQFPPEGRGVDL